MLDPFGASYEGRLGLGTTFPVEFAVPIHTFATRLTPFSMTDEILARNTAAGLKNGLTRADRPW
jgi:hypothetical protein